MISETQQGFVKNRFIGECTRLVFDLIEKTEKEQTPGLLLLLDFEKAFDSLEWNFTHETLLFYNFGQTMIQWVKTLYADISSSIQNNGHLSDFFAIKRGVRQGDPLSPYLFIICLELLGAALKIDPEVNGIKINNSEYLLMSYADDATLMLQDDRISLNKSLYLINSFSECSGLTANFEKTEAIWIGAKRGCGEEIQTDKTLKWNHEVCFKLLGIKYELNKQNFFEINFTDKIKKLKKLLEDWLFRNLSIMGKVTVVKTLAFPILVQVLTVLPDPPEDVFKQIDRIMFNFIWNGKIEKVKRTTLISNYDEGGLRVPQAKLFAKSLKTSWLKRIFDIENTNQWKLLLLDEIEIFGNKFWSLTKEGLKSVKIDNSFWKNVRDIWADLQDNPTTTPEEILSQHIWKNNHIKINRKPIFYKRWCKNGIIYLNDIIKNDGNFLTLEELNENFNMNVNFLDYLSIQNAIPREWRRSLLTYGKNLNIISNKNITILQELKKPSKFFHKSFVQQNKKPPEKAKTKWHEHLRINITEENWKLIFSLPFKESDDTKLQTLQFRINHRILYTNSYSWHQNFDIIMDACEEYARRWAKKEDVEVDTLSEWIKSIADVLKRRIRRLKHSVNTRHVSIFSDPDVVRELSRLHENFVIVPADKASNNYTFVCKRHYVSILSEELGLNSLPGNPTYNLTDLSASEVLDNHKSVLTSFGIETSDDELDLPYIYWIPKMHKTPYKHRFIAGSSKCSTKPLSILLTKLLTHIKQGLQKYCETAYSRSGINQMWILKNSKELLEHLKSPTFNRVTSIKSFDFSTLYTTIPHQKLKDRLTSIIRNAFIFKNGNRRYKYLVLGHEETYFVKEHSDSKSKYSEDDIIKMLEFLVDNIFVVFAGKVFQQTVGIPMGTNCAPLLADIFLYSYEADFIQSLLSTGKKHLASRFNLTYRYIDDVLSINNPEFENYLGQMYPAELEIKDTTESTTSASYLDLLLSMGRDGQLHTSIYDKRDDFNFHITNFPFLSSNIPSSPAYGVFISQLIRYARACSSYECFILRARRLSSKLLKQGYLVERLKSSFRKFYGRYGDLVEQYGVTLSRMLNDILTPDQQ